MGNVSHMYTFWCRPHINVPPHFLRNYLKMGVWSYQHPDIRYFRKFYKCLPNDGLYSKFGLLNLVSVLLKYVAGRNFFLAENVYNIYCGVPIRYFVFFPNGVSSTLRFRGFAWKKLCMYHSIPDFQYFKF